MLRCALILLCLTVLPAAARAPARRAPVAPRTTVAILSFDNNTGSSDYNALGKGIAAMMISDLSVVKELQLLERERIQELVKEMELQHTTFFDSSTAVGVGRMVGAQYIVVGAFAAVQPRMRIDTRVVRVATGEVVKTAQVTGEQDKFFDLEQALANKLIDGLGLTLSPDQQNQLNDQQNANRVDALSTMTSFSRGLARYDAGDYSGALEHMLPAMQASPNSMLLRSVFEEVKRRTANSAKDKAKEKVKAGLGGMFKRP